MANRVLDTNIVSFLLKDQPLAQRYRPHITGHQPVISFMTLGELLEGASRARWGQKKRRHLDLVLSSYVTVDSSLLLCEIWARIRVERRKQPIAVDDAWIAATALAYDCPLITHNPNDFRGISDLKVITEAG